MTNTISIIAPRGNILTIHGAGSGPVIVLVHGFPLDHRMWLGQMERLAEHYRVLAIDLRGFGTSTLLDEPYTIADLADDVECVRSHLATESKIVLCGLSMGGYVAFEYWQRYSSKLDGLVLCNTKCTADSAEAAGQRKVMAEKALKEGTWVAAGGMVDRMLGESTTKSSPQVGEQVKEWVQAQLPAAVAAAQYAMAERKDFTESLSRINIPTLVVASTEDSIAPPSETEQWAKKIPGAKYQIIESAGHLSPVEQPKAFYESIRDFLNSISRSPK